MLTGDPPFRAKTQKELDKKILSEKFVSPPYLKAPTHSVLKGRSFCFILLVLSLNERAACNDLLFIRATRERHE
jgi:hypothetical protein